ncbi:type III secretion system translocon subunit IpaB, partial [Shigella flexneri]|nr:type III secretion system translocon subunit IpaB [Shigella flexneri]
MHNVSTTTTGFPLAKILASTELGDNTIQAANDAANKLFSLTIADLTANQNINTTNAHSTSNILIPELKAPKSLNASSQLTLLIGNLIQILGEKSLTALTNKITAWKSQQQARQQKNLEFSDKINTLLSETEGLTRDYEKQINKLKNADSKIKDLENKINQIQTRLSELDPESPEKKKLSREEIQLTIKKDAAVKDRTLIEQKTLSIHSKLTDKSMQLEKEIDSFSAFSNTASAEQLSTQQKSLTGLASVTQLMATFIQLVGKNNEESLKNDLALFQSLQESRKTEMERKSDEYAAEVRKAEELNRVMGCVGKILGALLTIVSVVAAAFSGGASLALAAVGLALMVTDAIVQAATGNSFMEQALNPIMKAVIEPLIKLLSDAFTKMLEGLGVDSKKAKMIGSILGAIAGALVLVAAVVLVATVGKQAAAKLAENIGKIIGKTLTDLIPKFLKNFSSQLDDLITNAVARLNKFLGAAGDEVISKQIISTHLNQAVLLGESVNSATQAGGSVASAVFQNSASTNLADLTLSKYQVEQLSKYISEAIEKFGQL